MCKCMILLDALDMWAMWRTLNVRLASGGTAFAHRRVREPREQRERLETDALGRVEISDATVGIGQLEDGRVGVTARQVRGIATMVGDHE